MITPGILWTAHAFECAQGHHINMQGSMMENRSTILENRSNNSAVKIDNITSRDVSTLEQDQEIRIPLEF
jgi:hypothetical protein